MQTMEADVIEMVIPRPIRIWLKKRIQEATFGGANLPVTVMKYYPYESESSSYVIPKDPDHIQEVCKLGLPVPPKGLWLGYGNTQEEYLSSGELHVSKMLEVLTSTGFSFAAGERILDFGCGGGRMIRQLKNLSQTCEIWGTDIDARSIYWCKQYLEPPFHFFTATTMAHLPFADSYFGFIYAGSVFTHIDDLADAWLLELMRVLSPKGRLYITIHDNHTMELLDTEYRDTWLSKVIRSSSLYSMAREIGGKLVFGRDSNSQVFYDIGYFIHTLDSMYDIIAVIPEAYDYQTAILLKHKSRSKEQQ